MQIRWGFSFLRTLLLAACIGTTGISLIAYLFVAISRLTYPFTLEWIEGNTYIHVLRVLQGKAIYVAPSYDFIPMIYMPLYYYVAAIFSFLTGNIMFSMRLVSIISSIIAMGAIYSICRVRQLSHSTSVLAMGIFVAAYGFTGFWFDIGRVDMLFLALLLVGILLTISCTNDRIMPCFLGGVTLFLAFATKQQAILAYPFLLLYLMLQRKWNGAITFGVSFVALSVGYVLISNALTGGWFLFYTYKVPAEAPYLPSMFGDFWKIYLAPTYFPILAAFFLYVGTTKPGNIFRVISMALLVVPLLGMSVLSLAKQWGYINGLLPAIAGLAIMGAESFHYIISVHRKKSWFEVTLLGTCLMLILCQFIILRYEPAGQIPSIDNLEAGYRTVNTVQLASSPIFIPTSPYLLHMTGQQVHFHASSLGDINLAAERDPMIKAIYQKYIDGITFPLYDVKTAILPNANWYNYLFNSERGFMCENLGSNQPKLTTITGAVSYLDKICSRK